MNLLAPAKINLMLHVTGRRADGYHTLESVMVFTDICDEITISPAPDFQFEIQGPYKADFSVSDTRESNLVVRAARGLGALAGKTPHVKITLTKNIPLGAGLGGGSADAAATIRGLMDYWGISEDIEGLPALLLSLGADVPVCFAAESSLVRGVGEVLAPLRAFPPVFVVLVHPAKPCPTASVFRDYAASGQAYTQARDIPDSFENFEDVIGFLKNAGNDLTQTACGIVPEIAQVLDVLGTAQGCALPRMSGSGSTCFGLFADQDSAKKAADKIVRDYPHWWVRAGRVQACV